MLEVSLSQILLDMKSIHESQYVLAEEKTCLKDIKHKYELQYSK